MSLITFDIIYKKRCDNESIRLLPDSELQQLKLMICGKYKIYDLNNLYIYYKGNQLLENDMVRIKEIFKMKRVKIEISESPLEDKKEKFKYFCQCRNGATSICDKCGEFLCDFCYSKKKHINHQNKIIKLSDYPSYMKTSLKDFALELDQKILNDEAYQFFQYWNYDVDKEVSNINNAYEHIKRELEDIKQMQIDYIMTLGEANKYEQLKEQIELVITQYANINTDVDADFEKVLEEKKAIIGSSREILTWYNELKNHVLNYTKTIKDIQTFNQILIKEIKDKFNLTKKRYLNLPVINTNFLANGSTIPKSTILKTSNNNMIDTSNKKRYMNENEELNSENEDENQGVKKPAIKREATDDLNKSGRNNGIDAYNEPSERKMNNDVSPYVQTPSVNNNLSMNQSQFGRAKDKVLFKLKDDHKMIIFFISKQSFKEKNFYDKANFRKDFTTEADVIQINIAGRLFMLGGKNFDKFYFYDYPSNSIHYICNSIFSHYYGSMAYCNKYNVIYLLGGNNTDKCEACYINVNNLKKSTFKSMPSLNEARQEFASIYLDDYLYVFFGFSPKKGVNLSSIERLNVNTNSQFEVVYVNEQITLSSLACAKFVDDSDPNGEGILLLGGFDGQNYVDSSLVLNTKEMKIRDCDIVIPNMSKHFQFLFQKESAFIEFDSNQLIFDMRNNVHLLSSDSYELFSEAQ